MNTKIERKNKIKTFLRMQSAPSTITEIHEAISKRMHLKISRKTVERDIHEMIDNAEVSDTQTVPSRYLLNKPLDIELKLSLEELNEILNRLDSSSELYGKLRKFVE